MITQKSQILLKKMSRVIPGSASSNARCGNKIMVAKGHGAKIIDLDGNHYIDYVLGFGPIILGHGNELVADAVCRSMRNGTTFTFSHELELEVAEKIVSICPSIEMVRFCNSGTDAATTAYRIASTVTGRSRIIKIVGDYNGGYDLLLFDIPGVEIKNQLHYPTVGSTGISEFNRDLIITVPFNDPDRLSQILREHHAEVAAVFMEPIMGNTAAIMPIDGYLEQVRMLCDQYDVILVFDEVKTGFRVSLGGAQELFGVYSDLTMLGKAIANGLPFAAIGGKRQLMEHIAPGKVHHCGTYFGNMPCVAAANTVLSELMKADYAGMSKRGEQLAAGICSLLHEYEIPAHWLGVGSMFGITIGPNAPHDYRSWWNDTDRTLWMKVGQELLDNGILTDAFIGLFFLSFSHSDQDIQATLEICKDAIKQVKRL